MLKSLAHPIRIQMVLDLFQAPYKYSVTEFQKRLEISQSLASHHLSLLRTKGILSARYIGHERYYSLMDLRFAVCLTVLFE